MEFHDNPKPRKQIEGALEAGIPFVVRPCVCSLLHPCPAVRARTLAY
jgi:hypothetical protein